jgi:hypothetical protein
VDDRCVAGLGTEKGADEGAWGWFSGGFPC